MYSDLIRKRYFCQINVAYCISQLYWHYFTSDITLGDEPAYIR